MTRTVEDAALMMNVICKPDNRDWTALPYDGADYSKGLDDGIKGLRIAYSPALGFAEVDPEVGALVEAAVAKLADLGAHIEQVDPGFEDPGPSIFRILWWSGARLLLGKLPSEKRALLDPGLNDVVEQSQAITLDDYLEAQRLRGLLGVQMKRFMEGFDLLVTPCLPIAAFEVGKLSPVDDGTGKWVNWTPFTYPFNLTQQPACSVPCGLTKARLPVGLQLVGRMFEDGMVLRAAKAYQNAAGGYRPRSIESGEHANSSP
jgi:aspartyl-tRNA(Asn)/glutamyl-tRNA(Gln) amidotransferase subunit A